PSSAIEPHGLSILGGTRRWLIRGDGKGPKMLYTKDPYTGDHLVIDGTEVLRLRTRAEALEIATRRHEAACAERQAATKKRA
ncbi:MAG: hypothetical protein ACR2PK_20290, partial [Acidimicrobiales bacterium]